MTFSVALQYLAPQKTLSRIVRAATRWTWRPWKNFLIGQVVRTYHVDMSEAAQPDPRAYASFNAFFTRALRDGVRHADGDAATIACPADGRISQIGRIEGGRILQAKGRHYSVAELLADETAAASYREGCFATIYLSPRDYHRVHMPLDGELVETVHVPGRLFSVAPKPVADIPKLFARNERLICHFESEQGPFVVAMVAAMLVSGITTVWGGSVAPPYARGIVHRDWRGRGIRLARASEMARFEMGSTVVVLTPPGTTVAGVAPEHAVQVGQRLGDLSPGRFHVTIHECGGPKRDRARNRLLITQHEKSGDNHYFRRFVSRVTSMSRSARLRRQFSEIEQRSLELPRSYREQLAELIQRECGNVEHSDDPHMYGAQTEGAVTTGGLDVGYDRARSDNVQVRMRGLAMWLALVYHETKDASATDSEELHRQVLHVMRELKVFGSPDATDENKD